MDITDINWNKDDPEWKTRDIKFIKPIDYLLFIFLVSVATVITFTFGLFFGLLSATNLIFLLGAIVSRHVNSLLVKNEYAPAIYVDNVYTNGALLFVTQLSVLYLITNIYIGLMLSLLSVLVYLYICRNILFKDIGPCEKIVDTYVGPKVYAVKNGRYFEHSEKLAHKRK